MYFFGSGDYDFCINFFTILLNERHSGKEKSSLSSNLSGDYKESDVKETSIHDNVISSISRLEEGEVIGALQTSEAKLLFPADIANSHYFILAVPSLCAN